MNTSHFHFLSLSPPPPLAPSDFMVKVIEVLDSSQQKTLRGHEAPVLGVTFDPKDEFVVGLETDCFINYLYMYMVKSL